VASKLTIIGGGFVALVAVAGAVSALITGGKGDGGTTAHALQALPDALSCASNGYPIAFDKGALAFVDLTHKGNAQDAGIVAVAPISNISYFGTSALDKTDRVFTLQSILHPDGSSDFTTGTMRLHPVSSEGNDHYQIDMTAGGTTEQPKITRMLCVGPVAQKRYVQQSNAQEVASPDQKVASDQQAAPSQQQQMEWIVNKIASNQDNNCTGIARNLQTYMRATGVYDSPMISKLLYTARQLGCI